MSYYINPRGETKEEFLKRNGIMAPSSLKLDWNSVPAGFLPVVLINNGPFNAAGIAYSEGELEAFTQLNDHRPRQIFFVKIEELLRVVPDLADHLR